MKPTVSFAQFKLLSILRGVGHQNLLRILAGVRSHSWVQSHASGQPPWGFGVICYREPLPTGYFLCGLQAFASNQLGCDAFIEKPGPHPGPPGPDILGQALRWESVLTSLHPTLHILK